MKVFHYSDPSFVNHFPFPPNVVMMMDGRRRQESGTVHGSVTIHLVHLHAYHQHEQLQDSCF